MDKEKKGLEEKVGEVPQQTPQRSELSLSQKVARFLKNYAIDTSAKIAMWSPYMAALEASPLVGLDLDTILKVRGTSAIVDTLAARAYGKVLDWTRKTFNADKSALRSYTVDTATMIAYYGTLYAGYLKAMGADSEKILKAEGVGALAAIIGAKAFGTGLNKWRKKFGYQK